MVLDRRIVCARRRAPDEGEFVHAAAHLRRYDLADVLQQPSHRQVLVEHVTNEAAEAATLRRDHHLLGELGAHALALPVVADDKPHLHADIVDRSKVRKADDNAGVVVGFVLGDERQRPTVLVRDQSMHQGVRERRHDRKKPKVAGSWAQVGPQLANRCVFASSQYSDSNRFRSRACGVVTFSSILPVTSLSTWMSG